MNKHHLENACILFICAIAAFVIATSFINEQYFLNTLVIEDGLVEWLTVFGLLACAGLAIARFIAAKKSSRPATYLAGLLFATAIFLFGAGEEISWGQRIFQIESPEFFVNSNSQQETNLHNLVIGETKINKIIFSKLLGVAVLSFLFVLPALWSSSPKIRNLAAQWAVPVPRWKQSLLYLGLFVIASVISSSKRGELIEFAGCWMFFVIFLNPINVAIYRSSNSTAENEQSAAETGPSKQAA